MPSPFGEPSDELCFGTLAGTHVVFLPRHGRGHRIPPSEINFRANIDALKRAGVTELISLSAVGSLKAELPPGTFVLVDQFIDRTFARAKSFFGTGCVAHVAFGHPVCARARRCAGRGRRGGRHRAAARRHLCRAWRARNSRPWPRATSIAAGAATVIGMTNMPEAKLAREAELCYATVAMVTDYDCWHPDHDHVTVEMIIGVLLANAERARALVKAVVPLLGQQSGRCPQGCQHALDNALITAAEARDPALMAKLDAVAGRVLAKR